MRVKHICVFFIMSVLLLTVRPVFAHAVHVESSPAPNEILDAAPATVTIQFNEPVVPAVSQISVLNQTGEAVEVGALEVVAEDNSSLAVALPALGEGSYLVNWQVLSAVDGHQTSGTFAFGIGISDLATGQQQVKFSDQIFWASSVARWLRLLGIVLLVGSFTFGLFVWDGAELTTSRHRLKHIGIALLILALGLTIGNQIGRFGFNTLGAWLGVIIGRMWLTRLLLLLPLGLVTRYLTAGDAEGAEISNLERIGLLLVLLIALTNALTSHSGALNENVWQAVAVDLAHVLAAGVWGGGLLLLIASWRRINTHEQRVTLFVNFSTLAAFALAILFLTGGYLGWKHVGNWTQLVGTAYGLILLVKMALLVPILVIAGYNLLVMRKRLERGDENRSFGRIITIEAIIALLIIVTAGFVSDTQRAITAPLLTDEPGRTIVSTTAEDLLVDMTIAPALVGGNQFDILITDANGDPLLDAEEVDVRFTYLDRVLGTSEALAEHRGNGVYSIEGGYIGLLGQWQAEVSIRRDGVYDVFAPFRLEAGIGGEIRPIDAQTSLLERFGRIMLIAGDFGTGTILIALGLVWVFIAQRATQTRWQLGLLALACVGVIWLGISQVYTYYEEEFTPGKFTTNPILPDTNSVAQGEALYQTNCVACHGPEGFGDGPVAINLNPPPANFGEGHTTIHTDGDLYFWITNGVEGSAMPAFESTLSEDERWHLVNFVRRLAVEAEQSYANR